MDNNIGELRIEVEDLKKKISEIAAKKREAETHLNVIRNTIRCSGRMPAHKYKTYCESQNSHTLAILEYEKQMAPMRNRLREIATAEFLLKFPDGNPTPFVKPPADVAEKPEPGIIKELVELRQQYQQFAADGTRVSSMRQMAAEFVLKLNPIIKRQISPQ